MPSVDKQKEFLLSKGIPKKHIRVKNNKVDVFVSGFIPQVGGAPIVGWIPIPYEQFIRRL